MQRLDNADGFVVTDSDAMLRHAGVARCAPKVLADSTWLLARCATYQFASLDLEVGGASVAINAPVDDRTDAVAAAVAALADRVSSGLMVDAGRGLTDDDLAPLHAIDGRTDGYTARRTSLMGTGAAAACGAVRPLEGATVALDTLDATALAFATCAVADGARVVAVSHRGATVANEAGIDPAVLSAAAGGADLGGLDHGGSTVEASVYTVGADILAVGAKPGAIDHTIATGVSASVVVPTAWVPVTTRALAVLTRQHVVVLPDFVALAGAVPASGLAAALPDDDEEAARTTVGAVMAEVLTGVGEQWPNAVLSACARAEASLASRGHDLPVSRPLG
jgi:glutamate dehydrogenase/leucine dehydrogenase